MMYGIQISIISVFSMVSIYFLVFVIYNAKYWWMHHYLSLNVNKVSIARENTNTKIPQKEISMHLHKKNKQCEVVYRINLGSVKKRLK